MDASPPPAPTAPATSGTPVTRTSWAPHSPEFAAVADGLSLLMPHLEPLVVHTMRQARRELPDGSPLAAEVGHWATQEMEHQRQHGTYNASLLAACPALGRVDHAAARTTAVLRRRSFGIRVDFTAGFELLAYSVARWTAPRIGTLLLDADPGVADLLVWHLAEEVEHKAVAHDVHVALGRRSWRRASGVLLACAVVAPLTIAGALVRLRSQRRLRHPVTWWRLTHEAVSFSFELLTNAAAAVIPAHHPQQFADPGLYARYLADVRSGSGTRSWRPPTTPIAQTRPRSASNGPVTS